MTGNELLFPIAQSGVISTGDHARFLFVMIDLIILSFAVARLSNLFVNEGGPADMFGKLREWSGIATHFETGERLVVRPHPRAWLGDVLNCVYCCGMWLSIGAWAIYLLYRPLALAILVPFAIAHAALILLRHIDG